MDDIGVYNAIWTEDEIATWAMKEKYVGAAEAPHFSEGRIGYRFDTAHGDVVRNIFDDPDHRRIGGNRYDGLVTSSGLRRRDLG
jgi:hypothetical protein